MVAILKAVAAERITDGVQVIGGRPYMYMNTEGVSEERCVYVPPGYRHKYNTETGEIVLMKD